MTAAERDELIQEQVRDHSNRLRDRDECVAEANARYEEYRDRIAAEINRLRAVLVEAEP